MAFPAEKPASVRRHMGLDFLQTGATRRRFDARAYNRRIASMKLGLTAGALLLVGLVLAWPQVNGREEPIRLAQEPAVTERGATFSVSSARYFGVDEAGHKFDITAREAHNVSADSKRIQLTTPRASVEMVDTRRLDLSAKSGELDGTGKVLNLDGGVTLSHSDGYQVSTQDAAVNLDEGTAQGDQAVVGTGAFGRMEGEGFQIHQRGDVVRLNGSSRLLLKPTRERP